MPGLQVVVPCTTPSKWPKTTIFALNGHLGCFRNFELGLNWTTLQVQNVQVGPTFMSTYEFKSKFSKTLFQMAKRPKVAIFGPKMNLFKNFVLELCGV